MKRNVTKEIKTIARERVGRVKARRVITPKTLKVKIDLCPGCEKPYASCQCYSWEAA